MSAHKDLFDALWEYFRNSPDPEMTPQRASIEALELIDNYQDEVHRKCAQKIRKYSAQLDHERPEATASEGLHFAANLIDPDKNQPGPCPNVTGHCGPWEIGCSHPTGHTGPHNDERLTDTRTQ